MKLKAATLLESLVAMVVVMVCFGITSMIYNNVLRSDSKRIKLKAHLLLNDISIKTKKEKIFLDEDIQRDGILIRKRIKNYKEISGLSELDLTAFYNESKPVQTRRELICTSCE